MRHWMFRCSEVSQKVSQGLDAPLPLGTRLLVRVHLWMCRHCRRVYEQLRLLRKLSRHADVQEADCPPDLPTTLSPEARERIKKELRWGK
jgi:predicted anti-sigma-YlaC factor YlaD